MFVSLPVTAQMYHSLVQQQIPNTDNTVCVTPMQVQNFITSNSLCCGSSVNHQNATTYLMAATAANHSSNKGILNMPYQTNTTSCHVKTILASPVSNVKAAAAIIKKQPLIKKRILNITKNIKPNSTDNCKIISKSGVSSHIDNNNTKKVKDRNDKSSQSGGSLRKLPKKCELIKHQGSGNKTLPKQVIESKLKEGSVERKKQE